MAWLWVLVGAACFALSGLPGFLLARRSQAGDRIAVAAAVAGALLGLVGAVHALASADTDGGAATRIPWGLPAGQIALGLDALSAWFAVPVLAVDALGALYGSRAWGAAAHPRTAARTRAFYGTLIAAMALLALARDGLSFLIAWEGMALSAFFLIATEDRRPEVRQAGFVYLVATHAGTLCLFAAFLLLRQATGSFELRPLTSAESDAVRTPVFALALVGFGLKAGVMPLHFWLPAAHASAPSHVSAVLSGVMIKMGIYGLVRVTGLLGPLPLGFGVTLLVLGGLGGGLGVLYALAQHDLKRLLAYHSVENIGIILLGLGLALLGRTLGRDDWELLGMAGCLLHTWNHALFKSLLFMAAGSAVHACRTRALERMGGLAKRMPATAALFLVGAVAICGLPPLNGFVSELLIYLGCVRTVIDDRGGAMSTLFVCPTWPGAALGAAALALMGALALACFVKVYGVVFSGLPRTPRAARGTGRDARPDDGARLGVCRHRPVPCPVGARTRTRRWRVDGMRRLASTRGTLRSPFVQRAQFGSKEASHDPVYSDGDDGAHHRDPFDASSGRATRSDGRHRPR